MVEILVLRYVIESLCPDLPTLVGADHWPTFETELNGYLKQLEDNPERSPILRAQIQALFGRHPQAHQRLVESIAECSFQSGASWSVRGIVGRPGPVPMTEDSPGERQITRYTDIVCPRRIWVNSSRVPVVVRLTVQRSALSPSAEEMFLCEDLPVQVRIEASRFEILNAARQDIVLVRGQDSAPVVFDLHPRDVGHSDITLDFFQNGGPFGTATFAVEVTPYEVAKGAEARPVRPLNIEHAIAPPDMVLHIAWNQASSALHFTLIQDGGASWNDAFRPVPINGNPAAHAAELYRQISSLVGAADPAVDALLQRHLQIPFADVDRRVKALGQNLWRDLIPGELKTLYSYERERWCSGTTLILSDEPYIPWELVWPYEAGAWEDEGPWSQTLRLTRWLRKDDRGNGNDKAPGRLPANALAVLAPTYSLLENLPSAQPERQLLLELIQQHKLRDLSPKEATWRAVMNLLEAGGYDWLHVASHGNFYPDAPDGNSSLWLQRDSGLTPQHVAGMQIEGYLHERRPAFFFNACEVGRQGWALTLMGGWANRLISCGASMFIGPLWSVADSSALIFASSFYQGLFSGQTLAAATQQARLAAKQAGDPTYLAYSVYGHPNARLMTK